MKTLSELCRPRKNVFEGSRQDVVLDLTDLIVNQIDPQAFFEENYQTDGMKQLIRGAFRRFVGESSQGVFVLSQAMGGGKTHNMIALGLLAAYPGLLGPPEKFTTLSPQSCP
jgi:predicted AAA+ superfamily ATPase